MIRDKKEIVPEENDHENIGKAIDLIYDLIKLNENIAPNLWMGSIYYVLVCSYKEGGFSYAEFKQQMDKAATHYESLFD